MLKSKKIFISKSGEIYLLTGSRSIVYYLKDFSAESQVVTGKETSMLYQLIEYQGQIIGGNNDGLVRFIDNRFVQIEDLDFLVWSLMADRKKIWIGTEKGIATYSDEETTFNSSLYSKYAVNSIFPAADPNFIWLGTNKNRD